MSKSKLKTELSFVCLSLEITSQGMRKKTHIVYIANLVSLAVCCLEQVEAIYFQSASWSTEAPENNSFSIEQNDHMHILITVLLVCKQGYL